LRRSRAWSSSIRCGSSRSASVSGPSLPSFPEDRSERARLDVFVEWFNEVWKGPPNAIEAEEKRSRPDRERTAALSSRMRAWLLVFEGLLAHQPYLMGDEFTAADVCAFPFLK
jgi:glutathione S-transferase